ncbi:DUF4280 domain-containing protein [Clostridium saccharobutylicum]|uniref:DUF4280 domain-containing protein n=1 Tax=Clostridium saccharobutylicum DSM 13864 TaxID=1345695 RepID=U5MML0_CLOSA|nr:DUF4280 domain-containing protein [Clostridium saccharobutylicum]AGX41830.1 hypothetical protein CLSA_c08170 [Clostridium saccharobutylicum DSM 13864]AQR89106.1 hypothetical protein CLOSC_08020 [Clostridium saccharobutylicum]AQR99007.1 hypothetical protein CSACC_08090 [Clostridium saccharobutylicum]AQS08720.1 hypothetical protein CLOBY_08300 [Clostridium saccharobutylicum]AQS12995.1 hypothetical protein CLOSACC_08090 [Clostridium saccharobutylicum]
MASGIAYVVRGAKMKCDKGTDTKRINLPVSHGAYSNEKPIMNESDNIVGQNISSFGICSGGCPSSGGNEKRKKCQVKILKEWMNTKEDTLVEGEPALTTDSILICAYGGVIKFITDGQV